MTSLSLTIRNFKVLPSFWWAEMIAVSAISLVIVYLSGKKFMVEPNKFARYYQTLKTIKLFVFLLILAIYVFAIKIDAPSFLIAFMLYYLIFMFAETFSLVWLRK
jgi:hypothetical protein